ncbi:MAG: tRNA-specific 2-thiouridylase MnmA [Desulfovibrio sp.]
MTKRMTAVAVSGGMDSLFAMLSLQESGERILALHARMLPPDGHGGYEAMLERLAKTCASLGVPLHVIDARETFARKVIDPFVLAYASGETPNPCAHCNAAVKFGLLLEEAQNLGATHIATGHYARLEHLNGEPALYAGADSGKDQSYFLSLVPAANLTKAVLPLAETKKEHIRRFLEERGLAVPAPGESQEICFVPDDDYRAFLTNHAARNGIPLPGPGPVTLVDGTKIGEHKGLWQYTEGQRKGLGIAWKEPIYVLRKDMAANTLIADGAAAFAAYIGDTVTVSRCNFLAPFDAWPRTVHIRTRFRQKARPAKAAFDGKTLTLTEETPNGPYTKGQIATVYAEENGRLRVLGGGVISG